MTLLKSFWLLSKAISCTTPTKTEGITAWTEMTTIVSRKDLRDFCSLRVLGVWIGDYSVREIHDFNKRRTSKFL